MTHLNDFFPLKNILFILKYLECNTTPSPHLVNMQMSPASTQTFHWLTITRWSDWLQGRLLRQRFHTVILRLSFVRRKYSAMMSTYELTHGLSVLKTRQRHINNIKSLIFTTGLISAHTKVTFKPHTCVMQSAHLCRGFKLCVSSGKAIFIQSLSDKLVHPGWNKC